jgi:hypothetical protein
MAESFHGLQPMTSGHQFLSTAEGSYRQRRSKTDFGYRPLQVVQFLLVDLAAIAADFYLVYGDMVDLVRGRCRNVGGRSFLSNTLAFGPRCRAALAPLATFVAKANLPSLSSGLSYRYLLV